MITMQEMTALASEMIAAERDVEVAEAELAEKKRRATQLREESVPMAMLELGVKEFTLTTGEKVTIKQDVYASIPVANRYDAFKWLDDNGFGGLLKTSITANFGRGEEEMVKRALGALDNIGVEAIEKQDVNAMTLKAWLREQLEAGNKELDLDLFGARPVWVASVKRPSSKK